MTKSPKKKPTPALDPLPVPVPPPPPPAPCDLSAICDRIKSFFTTLGNAPSGSFLSIEDGALVVLPPPSPLTADLIAVLDHTTGAWTLATR